MSAGKSIRKRDSVKFEKSCGAVVFDKEKVLVVKHQAGHIDFPKGHMEEGETEEETAIREVKEETNIDIILENAKCSIHYSPKPGVQKEVVFFLAHKKSGTILPQLEEVQEASWIDCDEVMDILTFDTAREVFQKMLQEKTANH